MTVIVAVAMLCLAVSDNMLMRAAEVLPTLIPQQDLQASEFL
jgi:hypothetical protein